MADWEFSQLAVRSAPAVTDYVPLLVPTDTSTPPADLNGSDQRATLAALASFAAGTLAQKATVYVATTGSDSNDGASWQTAFLTVQHAVNALPTTSSIQGGIVEVGYGKFTSSSPIVIASTQNVMLRGRGPGQSYDGANNQTSPVYTTELHNSGTGDAIQVTGPSNFGPSGSPTNTGVVICDMAVTGNASSTYGINATYTEGVRLENVILDQHGVFGLRQSKVYGMLLRNVYISRCGSASSSSPGGGHFLDVSIGPNPGVNYFYSECAFNNGYGIYDAGSPTTSTGMVLTQSVFQNNAASAKSGSGCGLYSGGQWQATGCDFEANALYNIYAETGGQGSLTGCDILGDSVSTSGIYNGHLGGSVLALIGCRLAGHTTHGVDNTSGNFISWGGCVDSTDPDFIYNGSAANKVPADGFAPSVTGTTGSVVTGASPQALGSNGPVTVNASWGDNQVTLNANATSSTAVIGPPGQFLDLTLIQGSGGSHTWAWFTNVTWSSAGVPVISTTAGAQDSFRFRSDGTNWVECRRSIGDFTGQSRLKVTGKATPVTTYAVTTSDFLVLADATSASFNVTLPDATTCAGQIFAVKQIDTSAHTVTVLPHGGQTIDGGSAWDLGPYAALVCISDGANFRTILAYGATQNNLLDDGHGLMVVTGNLDIGVAGKGLQVKEGSNAKQGTATLTAGAVTVANTSVTANSRIFLTIQSPGGTAGSPFVFSRSAGASFVIHSTSGSDTSVVAYEIVEPG